MDGKDCCPHAILGVKDDANLREIRRAYRVRLLRVHPDHGGNASDLAQVINAYKALIGGLPSEALKHTPAMATQYGPRGKRSSAGSYSDLGAKRYSQSMGPVLFSQPGNTSVEDSPSPRNAGGFSDVLQRAIKRVEELQVELLVPDYSH